MKEEEVYINGLKINYKVAGGGQPVLILHGWGGSSGSWLEVQGILSREGYKVIIPDFPGFGKSITPPKPWGIKEYTDLITEFTEKLKLDEFFLIGHSFGGRIAIRFSVEYPQKVKRLILCDSAGIKPKPGLKTLLIFWSARIGNAIFTPKHLQRFKDTARNFFYIFIRHKDYVKANGVMKETIKKVLDEDLLLDLSEIKNKTLIVWGGWDKMVPLKYAHVFNEKIENSKLEIMPKVGHSPHLENPKKLSEIILKFLKE
ncbi:MAG: alpha/beta hydrolase [Candidatus Pacebacteria bacterium]|nr:alpha/beta hydrolase [Candidatus Paceibacterota bacterium]